MDVGTIQTLITSLGFPIVCVIALAYFIWKIWNNSEQLNKEREEKLYDVIKNAQQQNKELSETNQQFVEVLQTYRSDLQDIKSDVEEIKTKL